MRTNNAGRQDKGRPTAFQAEDRGVRLSLPAPFKMKETMYIKPTANFRISNQTKSFMSSIVNAEERNAFKNAMIQAELEAATKAKERKDKSLGNDAE